MQKRIIPFQQFLPNIAVPTLIYQTKTSKWTSIMQEFLKLTAVGQGKAWMVNAPHFHPSELWGIWIPQSNIIQVYSLKHIVATQVTDYDASRATTES